MSRVGRRMRTRAVAALLAAASLSAAGCGNDSASASDPAGPQHFRMAFFSSGVGSAYPAAIERGARDRAVELGVVLDVFDAESDSARQVQQMREAIASGQYVGGFVVPVAAGPLCDVGTNFAPEHNFMLAVTDTPICGRDGNEGDDAWAPGTLTFVSAGRPLTMGATAVQALYDARVGRTPITRFYAS